MTPNDFIEKIAKVDDLLGATRSPATCRENRCFYRKITRRSEKASRLSHARVGVETRFDLFPCSSFPSQGENPQVTNGTLAVLVGLKPPPNISSENL